MLLPLLAALPVAAQPLEMRTVTPAVTDAPLLNPGMGIYVMAGAQEQPDPEAWFMQLAGIAYNRCHWADLEPERGVYRFDEFLGPMFDYWVHRLGKRVAFRVMCESMHGNKQYVTPQWVYDAGVPGVHHVGLYVEDQVDPVFWDPLYLDLHCEFIRAFGEWADGREGLEFVDIGSIGEWGEMHFGLHIPGRWTAEELQETGFTEYKIALAYRRVIDTFAEAFPSSRVFLNVGGRQHINDYAAKRGIHFRQDGLGPTGASHNVESTLYPQYGFSGTMCNLELIVGYGTMQQRGWSPLEVIRKGLTAPLSYQNINFGGTGFLADAPDDVREAVDYCARHIGYRYALRKVTLPARTRSWDDMPGRLPLQQVWENLGVAPAYENLAFEWQLLSPDGEAVASAREFPTTPTTRWLPGEPVQAGALLEVPPGLAPGIYGLTVRMFLPEAEEKAYYIPLEIMAEPGVYRVAEVEVVRGEATDIEPVRWTFEEPGPGARVPEGMTAEIVDDPVHSGGGALRLSGTSADAWAYGVIDTVPVVPGGRYRLSGWVRFDSLNAPGRRPSMKLGMNAADGTWITNANTQPYDTKQLTTWQHLVVEFDCPVNAATGDITVERGGFGDTIEAELYLDDVELTLISAP